jgi:hypothetical protein
MRRLMWAAAALMVAAAILALLWLAVAPPADVATRVVEKGTAFTGYSSHSYDGNDARTSLRALRATGATWAMVLVTVYQDNVDSTTIGPSDHQTPSDASLQSIIAYAHKIGLKVMLKPVVDLLNDPTHWRGQIGVDFTAADWAAWFASYDETNVHYAQLAAETHCEQFCVGCELDSTIPHEAAWRQLIRMVRDVYKGKLTYAAHLWTDSPSDVHNPQFWNALDLIGVDMYPTLSSNLHPTVAQLVAGWKPIYEVLAALHQRWHRPIIFTEIGIRSIVGAARAPEIWRGTGEVDLVGQERWYQAALQTFAAHPWMQGLFFWQWLPNPNVGGPQDGSYSPHGKPAEVVLRYWFEHKLHSGQLHLHATFTCGWPQVGRPPGCTPKGRPLRLEDRVAGRGGGRGGGRGIHVVV